MDLDLLHWKPEIDTFIEFKTRIIKKTEKEGLISQVNPDFEVFFRKAFEILGIESLEDENWNSKELNIPDERVDEYINNAIIAISHFQHYHELYVRVPENFLKLNISNIWVKVTTEFMIFCANMNLLKGNEIQEKYYLVLPLIERAFSIAIESEDLSISKIILLILIYKIYTSALQKNKFMNDVQDLFNIYIAHLELFDRYNWKNPLLDNFLRMLAQVGLMLNQNDSVLSIIKHRIQYLTEVKANLVNEQQDIYLILNIINVNFSIAKNYLQIGDTSNHEINLTMAYQWLDEVLKYNEVNKKAWKLKVKMIRSYGHNALRRGAYSECYLMYLKALVYSYHYKLAKEYKRAMMYVTKYQKFFSAEQVESLEEYLNLIPETLNKTHLLYLIGKEFVNRKNFSNSVLIQELIVKLLEREYNKLSIDVAIEDSSDAQKQTLQQVTDLYVKNLDYLGNLKIKTRNIDEAVSIFEKEASLFESEKPRKQLKIYMKIAKELNKFNRFKEAFEYGEKSFSVANEFGLSDYLYKILTFLVETAKLADLPEKLAIYKRLLYQ
ncbi:MAG: hypothetical protein ACTSVI_13475 [Promethearchaeota archaeon]